jgi:TonB family protein
MHMPAFGWDPVDGGRGVRLYASAVRGLRTLAIDGFTALRRRGVETGGVLLGTADSGEFRIETFEVVPCEHRFGPSYDLSENDRMLLRELLAALSGGTRQVVGFFRSFTARDPVIGDEEAALAQEYFPHGEFVYLMLQPLSVERCLASFRLIRDGEFLPGSKDPPIAFDAPDTGQAERQRPAPALQLAPDPEPAPEPPLARVPEPKVRPVAAARETEPGIPPDVALPPRQWARWWIPALIGLACAVGGAMAIRPRLPAAEPRPTELHLDARPVDGRLEVSWDPNAAGATHAAKAELRFTDGDAQHNVDLDPGQIQSGKFSYRPQNGDVKVQMRLYTAVPQAGDTLRVKTIPVMAVKHDPSPPPPLAPEPATPALNPKVTVTPAAVYEVQPVVPEGIRSRIGSEVVVPVEVEVNEQGHVIRAVAAGRSTDGVGQYLEEQARKAARKWRFRPARDAAGEPVAANRTIRFVFRP